MATTISGERVSAQIGKMGVIADLQDKDFSLVDGNSFCIKNDGDQPVRLHVQLAGMNDGDFVETQFDRGWNPEIVRVVKATSLSSVNLKWGY